MKGLDQYLVLYLVSQVVAIVVLMATYRTTRIGRLVFAMMFIWASVTNMNIGVTKPDTYLEYGKMALPFYRDFINGWFSRYNHIVIPLIAVGQLLIGIGMLLKGWWVRWACIGAIIFLLCITPLIVGSAFPFPLIVAWAAWIVLKRDKKAYLWQRPPSNEVESVNKNRSLEVALFLSQIALMLSLLASATGLFADNIYRDNDFVQTAWHANDWVTLLLVIPTLAVTLFLRHSAKLQLIWAGLLAYLFYNYAFYLFGAAFNNLFLVYVGIVALSLFALVALLSALPVQQFSIPSRFSKLIIGYLLLIAVMLFMIEVPPAIAFSFTGSLPEIVIKSGHPTSIVYALDLTLIVPAALLSALWLAQRKPWGVVLSAIMLVKGIAYGTVLCAATLLARHLGVDNDPLLPFYLFITIGGIAGLIGLLKLLKAPAHRQSTTLSSVPNASFSTAKPAAS
jgi:hypothetical protein